MKFLTRLMSVFSGVPHNMNKYSREETSRSEAIHVLTIRSYEPRDAVGEIQNLTPSDRGEIEIEIVLRVLGAGCTVCVPASLAREAEAHMSSQGLVWWLASH